MVSRASRSRRDLKDNNAAIRVLNFLDLHTKANLLKQPLGSGHSILKCLASDYLAWRFVGDAE